MGDRYKLESVITRHSGDCDHREDGASYKRCGCRKAFIVYDSAAKKQLRISAQTRNFADAEKFAEEWIEKQTAPAIERAIAAFLKDMIHRLGNTGTLERMRALLGHVDPETAEVKRKTGLLLFVDSENPRPISVSDLTTEALDRWRASWKMNDLTSADSIVKVKQFFKFCFERGWLPAGNPAAALRRPKVARGNRTAIFSDAEYAAILAAAKGNPESQIDSGSRRLVAFVELLRWSGMALVDAVQFTPNSIQGDLLTYRRQKTGTTATPILPGHVLALLRNVPVADDGVGPEMPFRAANRTIHSDEARWRRRLQALFAEAGITTVQTDIGPRAPHPHMLRDTFAVSHIRAGVDLLDVSRMLGHSNTQITERSYLPWVLEMRQAHQDRVRAKLSGQLPKKAGEVLLLKRA